MIKNTFNIDIRNKYKVLLISETLAFVNLYFLENIKILIQSNILS